MKKVINVFLAVVITLFSIPLNGLNVSAEGNIYDDGIYDLPLTLLKDGTDNPSKADEFVDGDNAKLKVNNGILTVQLTLKRASWWQDFQVETLNGSRSVRIVEEDVENDTRIVEFDIDDATKIIDAKISISSPFYSGDYDVQIKFDTSQLPELQPVSPQEPEDNNYGNTEDNGPDENENEGKENDNESDNEGEGNNSDNESNEEESNGSEDNDQNNFVLENGYYTVDVSYVHLDGDKPSAMARYLGKKAFLDVNEQNVNLTITVADNISVKRLLVENKSPIEVRKDGEKSYLTFNLNSLENVYYGYTEYQVLNENGEVTRASNAGFYIYLDSETIQEAELIDKPGYGLLEEPISIILEDGSYSIDVNYLKIDEDDSSSMNRYLGDSAFVTVKDGKAEVTITVKNINAVTKLKLQDKFPFEKKTVNNERYERFLLNEADLKSILSAYVEYQAPMGPGKTYYGNADFRIKFDLNSVRKVDESEIPGIGEEGILEIVSEAGKPISTDNALVVSYYTNENDLKILLPEDLPNGVAVKIEPQSYNEDELEGLSLAGGIFDITFSNLNGYSGTFTLEMSYDTEKYSADKVGIYHYNENTGEWEKVNNSWVEGGKVFAEVDHFSIYGVLAEQESIPEDPKTENPILDPTNLNPGVYTINYKFNKPEMYGYTDGPAYIKVDNDGNIFVAMKFTSASMFQYIDVNNERTKIIEEIPNENARFIEFTTDDLSKPHSMDVKVYVPNVHEELYTVEVTFDVDSINIANDNDYPGNKAQGPTPSTPTPGNKVNKDKKSENKIVKTNKPDEVFKFNYVVLHEKENRPSAANNFFTNVGYLLKKDGKQYIQLEIDGWQYVDWIKVMKTGKLVDLINVENDVALIQFEYNGSLEEEIWLEMSITVPGIYDGEVYKVRLVVDQDSIVEVNPANHEIYTIDSTPSKPDLNDKHNEKSGNKNPTDNPKTGDTSQVLFYTVLLIASLIALVYQVRKQLATSA